MPKAVLHLCVKCRVPRLMSLPFADLPKPRWRPMLGHSSRGGGIIGSKQRRGKAGMAGAGLGKSACLMADAGGGNEVDVTAIRPLVAGNWKMNGLSPSLAELAALKDHLAREARASRPTSWCARRRRCSPAPVTSWPEATSLSAPRTAIRSPPAPIPAISPPRCWLMPARPLSIVGHSERRTDHGESRCAGQRQGEGGPSRRADRHDLRGRDREGASRRRRRSRSSAVS